MMKLFFAFCVLNISYAWANKVPVSDFDQSKLEQLLSRIPETFVKEEEFQGFKRRHYSFPKNKSALGIVINCSADYYNNAMVPSVRRCDVSLKDNLIGPSDQSVVTVTNSDLVSQLYNGISYGSEKKKIFSTEIFQAVNLDGTFRDTFRYSIVCDKKICELKFVL